MIEEISAQLNALEKEETCALCLRLEAEHVPSFRCVICYMRKPEADKVKTNCCNNCVCCGECLQQHLISQI